jgi:predicted HicB family RNase H-like nuclease
MITKKRFIADVDIELHRDTKIAAAQLGVSMSTLILELLRLFMVDNDVKAKIKNALNK